MYSTYEYNLKKTLCPRAYTRTLFWGKIEITKSTTVKPVND